MKDENQSDPKMLQIIPTPLAVCCVETKRPPNPPRQNAVDPHSADTHTQLSGRLRQMSFNALMAISKVQTHIRLILSELKG